MFLKLVQQHYDLHGCLDSCEVFIKIGYFQATTNQSQLIPANVNWFDTNQINFFNDQLVSQISALVSKDKKASINCLLAF